MQQGRLKVGVAGVGTYTHQSPKILEKPQTRGKIRKS